MGGKSGFFAPGKTAILFEGHILEDQLKRRGISPERLMAGNENI
nr:N-acetylmuramidase domain-containing protein [Bacteroides sp.]